MARSYTITQDGESRIYTIEDGIGPAGASVTVDQTIIDGSTNAVSGNAVFDGLALKAPLANPTFTGIVTAPRITGRCDGLEVFCKAGLAINAGQVVYVTGADGNNIIIGLAQANTEPTSSKTIGISESTLANNATGYVITEGLMTVSISAPSAVEGDPIWLSPSTAGGMVFGAANKPVAPNHMVYLGVVTRKTGNNVVEIYVKIQNGSELDELADVAITSPAAGQALMRGASFWENRSLVSADISDASEGGNESSDAAKLVKYKSDGSIFASTFVRASLPSNGNAYAQLQSAGTESGLVLYKSATASATIANSSVTGDRVLQSPDLSGTIALTSDSRFTDERVPTAAGLTSKFGTNKATVVDADKVAILDSAASDAPKHSTLSAIWTWIQSKFASASSKTTPIDADSFNLVDSADSNAAKRVTGTNLKAYLKTYLDTLYVALTGDQTIAGAKTFSGQTELTGQAATNSTSAMTRDLVGKEDFYNIGRCFKPTGALSHTNSGTTGAISAFNSSGISMVSGTVASGYGNTRVFGEPVGSDFYMPFSIPQGFAVVGVYNKSGYTDPLGVFRILIGYPSAAPTAGDANALSNAGYGMEVTSNGTNHVFRAVTHNGTTFTAGSWVTFGVSNEKLRNRSFIVESDAAGNITASISAVDGKRPFTTATTTGGPTGNGSGTNSFINFHTSNNASGTPLGVSVYLKDFKCYFG